MNTNTNFFKSNHRYTKSSALQSSVATVALIAATTFCCANNFSERTKKKEFSSNEHKSSLRTKKKEFSSNEYKNILRTEKSSFGRKDSLLSSLMKKIDKISTYEDGWNTSNSKRAKKSTLSDAKKINILLSENNITHPSISLADDGEINFYWNEEGILDLGVFGDGTYSYYFKGKDGKEIFADDKAINEILTDEIINHITV